MEHSMVKILTLFKKYAKNIVDTALGLDFINDLTVKDFTMIDTDKYLVQKNMLGLLQKI